MCTLPGLGLLQDSSAFAAEGEEISYLTLQVGEMCLLKTATLQGRAHVFATGSCDPVAGGPCMHVAGAAAGQEGSRQVRTSWPASLPGEPSPSRTCCPQARCAAVRQVLLGYYTILPTGGKPLDVRVNPQGVAARSEVSGGRREPCLTGETPSGTLGMCGLGMPFMAVQAAQLAGRASRVPGL